MVASKRGIMTKAYKARTYTVPVDCISAVKKGLIVDFIDKNENIDNFNVSFAVGNLSELDCQIMADKCSSDCGTYYYYGIQYEFDELVAEIKKEFRNIVMDITYRGEDDTSGKNV